ncbi:nucleoside-triphosphate diphosphatase [Streptococcus sp. sy018]|uniref:nucleoside-triphosphate diphosphatase n=1 Tax=Streptococcus sp. sy018 TaxID=2600147 RepID=UPI0011B80443|nr:nucleoside-triphosphate diphosphatase [Streptococcus sp. sy018]TWS94872.1 nucleoside-triphosphate diphosphatase [Streptococcus sp. sy018]
MSEKLYEYKTEEDWFVAKWGVAGPSIHSFVDYPKTMYDNLNHILLGEESSVAYDLFVIKLSSNLALVQFILDMLNQEQGRQLTLTSFKGLMVISEQDKILWIQPAKSTVKLSELLAGETRGLDSNLLIATRNEGKTKEFRDLFAPLGIAVQNLNDYPDLPEVAETGMTFEENARLKAETIANLTGQMVLADDSGLKVDLLGGLPGVWSARFAGQGADDQANNAKLLHELAVITDLKRRSAQFHTTLVVAVPERDSLVVSAEWEGYIAFGPKGENGFGYDPIFLVGETGQTAAQLSATEKNQQSHRGQAVKKLMEVFPKWQLTL